MNQLPLFEILPAPMARTTQPAPKPKHVAGEARSVWSVGMLVRLPITAGIEGETWRQYTMGLSGRVELIEGALAGVRIASPGHKFHDKLGVAHLAALSANN